VIEVRPERPADRAAVRHVVEAAFGRREEADLVDALRNDPAWELSLVAEVDGAVAGHILFTRARVDDGPEVLALAPLAVLPEHQRTGVGAALMGEGLRRVGEPVVVLGHPDYYARFGFEPAARVGLSNDWGAEGPEWMVRGTVPPGHVIYPAPFGAI
jgi:putative acetyltransferase